MMEAIAASIVNKYGLFGAMVLFLMLAYWLQHRSLERKDTAIEKMANDFSSSLRENTFAIHAGAQAHIKLADATNNVVAGFDRTAAQNREEHSEFREILETVRARVGR